MNINLLISSLLLAILSPSITEAQCVDCYFNIEKAQSCEEGQTKLKVSTNGTFTNWTTPDNQNVTIVSPNEQETVVKPTKAQTYIANGAFPATNLISNGDFESGNTGFSTDYTFKETTGGFSTGSDITIEAEATDDGTITAIEFFNGSNSLEIDNTSPYTLTLTNAAEGIYFIRGVATDNNGASSSSELFPILVGNGSDSTSIATLTKRGSGSSSQTIDIGDPIEDFYYEWTNATTVEIFGLPDGITASIDNTNKEVSFSGTPTEVGNFKFSILTSGGSPDTYKNGEIIVDGVGNQTPDVNITSPHDGIDFNAGDFGIGTNPQSYSTNFINKKDHTGNNGNMFIGDGSRTSGDVIYTTTINLEAGKDYIFSAWFSNIHKEFLEPSGTTANAPEIAFDINGTTVSMGDLPADTAWHKLSINWTAEATGPSFITIFNLNNALNENDFAMDDVGFYEVQEIQKTITVSPCGTNIFSPNGDGIHEEFFIDGTGSAKIFSPQGTLVREVHLPVYWDGTDRDGKLVNAGYYAIIINDTTYSNVTVVR